MNRKSRFFFIDKLLRFLFVIITLLINSCDDKVIVFNPNPDVGLNYFNQSFFLDLNESIFQTEPAYLEQGSNPNLYIGNISNFNEENLSYALFQFDPDIINDYGICDSSLVSIDNLIFTLKFDDLNIEYMLNDDSSYVSQNYQMTNNNSSYNFSNSGIEENVDSAFIAVQTPYYIKPYIYHGTMDFSEDDSMNHDSDFISNLLMDIKCTL